MKLLLANLIEKEKPAEDKARKLFRDVKDQSNVELSKFKEVVAKIAADHKRSSQEALNQLAATGPKFLDAIEAAAIAFKETLRKNMSK